MNEKKVTNEILTILFSALILSLVVSFNKTDFLKNFLIALISFTTILFFTALVKSIFAYTKEMDTETKFLMWKQYGKKRHSHFKYPLPLIFVSLLLAPLGFWWFGILETETTARTERVAKRHKQTNRFSKITEWHKAWVAVWGIITLMVLATIGKIVGMVEFSMFNIYYMVWSIIPLGKLDGSKIFFGSRNLWFATIISILIFLLIFFS